MTRPKFFLMGLACAGLWASGCGGGKPPQVLGKPAPARAARLTPERAPLGPARYVLTDGVGVSFDEAGQASPLLRREGAIAAGNRLLLEGGLVVLEARGPEPLVGFRAIPPRLGGGFLLWSDARTYRAETFLGELRPIVDVAAEGGARPWLRTIALRTSLGVLELDPATNAVRRTDLSRFSEVFAVDQDRGARLDTLGRAELTTDGGKTFRDVTAERGERYFGLEEGRDGKLLFSSGYGRTPTLGLDAKGTLAPFVPPYAMDEGSDRPALLLEDTASPSRALASADLANAVFAGAQVLGGRVVVVRDQHLRVLGLATGQVVDDAPLPTLSERFSHCQAAAVGDGVVLACTHAYGAHLLVFGGDPSAPRLEATFPEPGGFVAGLGKRFAFHGRCGAKPPSVADFRGLPKDPEAASAGPFGPSEAPPAEEPEPPEEPDKPEMDRAFACVRGEDGAWIERKLTGDAAEHFYRFVPGDGGAVTALVLGKAPRAGKDKPNVEAAPEGVRVIRIDPDDPKLAGASFPALPVVMEEAPHRSIDTDFWLDEKDGSVHGWVALSSESDENGNGEERELVPQGRAGRLLPVSTRLGGAFAGVRIGPTGAIEIHPLPASTVEVIRGGPYGLARAETEEGAVTYETTDGGQTWRPIEPSPLGDFSAAYSETAIQGCSALGCALGDGVVRLGWGGAAPKPKSPPEELTPAQNPAIPRPSSIVFRCRLEKEKAPRDKGSSEESASVPVTLRVPGATDVGEVRAGSFFANVYLPFDPRAARRVSMKAPGASSVKGEVVPVLLSAEASPVGLFVRGEHLRFDLALPDAAREAVPFQYERRIAVAAELGRGEFAFLDADDSVVSLVRGGVIRQLAHFGRVPDVNRARITLARRMGKGDAKLALAAVSATSGDILVGELDLGRASVGPMRSLGNLGALSVGPACRVDGPGYRLLADVIVDVRFEGGEDELDAPYQSGLALVVVGGEKACLEAVEVRLPKNNTSLVARLSAGGAALVRAPGRAERASCVIP